VVSHDRFFVERVCDDVFALDGRGGLRHLPGGVEQYLAERRDAEPPPVAVAPRGAGAGGQRRALQKEAARLERAIEKAGAREAALQDAMAAAATDHARLRELSAELTALRSERDELEAAWLEAAEVLEA
jgi:ABC transport system ATP-binding/permease protein